MPNVGKETYRWLRKYKFENLDFDLIEDKKEQPMELFVLNTTTLFWELCLKRVKELENGYQYAKLNNQKINMALLERAALETFAVAVRQIISLENLVNSKFENEEENKEYAERTKKLFLGMRSLDKNNLITSTNIVSHLEKANFYLKKYGECNLLEMYESLSNYCHPNLAGLTGNYYPKILEIKSQSTGNEIKTNEYFLPILLLFKHFDEKVQELKEISKNSSDYA
ncbi:hypothetical protein M0P48_00505 [Candidatus Gracilibacteria bacterium]|nr:hypothetical protein [Candidatus Gracilibacteria bacterium]